LVCVKKGNADIGRTDVDQHTINTGNPAPIPKPYKRLPLGKRQIERDEIDNMLMRGLPLLY